MKINIRAVLWSIFHASAFAMHPAQAEVSSCARVFLKIVVDPIESILSTREYLYKRRWSSQFDTRNYDEISLRLKNTPIQNWSSIHQSRISDEEIFARLDYVFDQYQYSQTTRRLFSAYLTNEGRQFVNALKRTVRSNKSISESQIQKLSTLYYGISRKLSYEPVEALLRNPVTSRGAIIDFQTERLFLNYALTDFFGLLGIPAAQRTSSPFKSALRAVRMSLLIPLKLVGLTKSEVFVSRLVLSKKFQLSLWHDGYQKTIQKLRPEVEKNLKTRAEWEVFLAGASAIYSTYLMYEIATEIGTDIKDWHKEGDDNPKNKKKVKPQLSADEMRKKILSNWERTQADVYGVDSISSSDRDYVVSYYNALSDSLLDSVYQSMNENEKN